VDAVPNVAPTVGDDSYSVSEDDPQAIDVLQNDDDPDGSPSPLIARNASDPPNGTVTLTGDGTFTYTPDPDFNGSDSFTYEAFDGEAGATATVTITVTAVNDAPSFTAGGDVTVNAVDGTYDVEDPWATSPTVGPSNESGQTVVGYDTSVDPVGTLFFSVQPSIAPDGKLTFTPNGLPGEATVTVTLQDNGGTANGGDDTSEPQSFKITIN